MVLFYAPKSVGFSMLISLRRGDIWPDFWPRQLVSLPLVRRPRYGRALICISEPALCKLEAPREKARRQSSAFLLFSELLWELNETRLLLKERIARVARNINLYGISKERGKAWCWGSWQHDRALHLACFHQTFINCCSCKSLTITSLREGEVMLVFPRASIFA